VTVMVLRTHFFLPMKVPVHKIQTFFTIFVVVCTNHSCLISIRSNLVLPKVQTHPFAVQVQPTVFFEMSLTQISSSFFSVGKCHLHISIASRMRPVSWHFFIYLDFFFSFGTEESENVRPKKGRRTVFGSCVVKKTGTAPLHLA
jgi:hypothetical protein